jgi:hypothetical protein
LDRRDDAKRNPFPLANVVPRGPARRPGAGHGFTQQEAIRDGRADHTIGLREGRRPSPTERYDASHPESTGTIADRTRAGGPPLRNDATLQGERAGV